LDGEIVEEIPIFVGAFFAALVLGFVCKARLSSSDVTIITSIGLAMMLISMPFIPTDKDGHLNFLWTAPYLFCGSVGACIGLSLERLRRKEQ
jgi:hypothetical protein